MESVMAAVVRGWAFAHHADLIWMETASLDMMELTNFFEGVRSKRPETMLAYNLSPSFNWDASGMNDMQMMDFIPRIAKLGFCWQFITVAVFHPILLVIDTFAKDYTFERGILAYVDKIEGGEEQRGVTEDQFKETWTRKGSMGSNVEVHGARVCTKNQTKTENPLTLRKGSTAFTTMCGVCVVM
ncbi:hypothetical protein IFM89_021942 [Coptis chinensis]|uniref:Isocitrate lyase n=1 Tax=Coptis chinensis TaxID=261450 RepID=A0A835HGG5_9MAGN|nr:hypothetical protein IFM89_021942 [Coptis chinensis]